MAEILQQGLWGKTAEGDTLLGSCCSNCGVKAFPHRKVCPRCCSEQQTQIPLSRRGKIYSYTRIFIEMPAMDEAHYLVGYVLLEDGITVPARLRYFDDNPEIGTTVVLETGITGKNAVGEGITGYYFRPEKGGEECCRNK